MMNTNLEMENSVRGMEVGKGSNGEGGARHQWRE